MPQVAPDGERGFQRIFSVLFSSYESVSKLALFSVLCIVGNLETFGLANFWPILLHDQFPSKSATSNPAMQLLLLRLWGVPASVLTFFVLSLPFLGHRLGLCWGPTPGGPYVVEQEGWQNGPAVRGGGDTLPQALATAPAFVVSMRIRLPMFAPNQDLCEADSGHIFGRPPPSLRARADFSDTSRRCLGGPRSGAFGCLGDRIQSVGSVRCGDPLGSSGMNCADPTGCGDTMGRCDAQGAATPLALPIS